MPGCSHVCCGKWASPARRVASAVFALHPVAVESVAWITERKNVLSLFFYLLSATAYWPRIVAQEQSSRRVITAGSLRRRWWIALACYVAARWSKTVACSLPAALLLMIYGRRGRVTWRDVVDLLPFFIVGVVLALNTARLERLHVGAFGPDFELSWLSRVIIAGRAIGFYLSSLVWPWPLAFSYERWDVTPTATALLDPLAVAALVIALYVSQPRIGRWPLVALLFFIGTLFPALGFFNVYPFRFSYVADHFQYLAMLGPIALFAAGIALLLGRFQLDATALRAGVTTLLAVVLGGLSWWQCHDYRDLETLCTNTIAKSPRAWLAWQNLGALLRRNGLFQESLPLFEEAIKIRPDAADVHANYGTVLFDLDRHAEAQLQFERALELWPVSLGARARVRLPSLASHDVCCAAVVNRRR